MRTKLCGALSPGAKCGGCQLQNMEYERQLRFQAGKVQSLLGKYGKVKPILGMEYPYHYRNKVQAAFGVNRRREIISGVYQSSHTQNCPCRLLQDGRPNGGCDHCYDPQAAERISSVRIR